MYYRSTFAKATADKAIGDVNTTHDTRRTTQGKKGVRRQAAGGRHQAGRRQASSPEI